MTNFLANRCFEVHSVNLLSQKKLQMEKKNIPVALFRIEQVDRVSEAPNSLALMQQKEIIR